MPVERTLREHIELGCAVRESQLGSRTTAGLGLIQGRLTALNLT
jgi:hypothetical protein